MFPRGNHITLHFPDSNHHDMMKSSHPLVTRFQEQHQEQLDRDFNCGIINAEAYANMYNISQGLTPTVRYPDLNLPLTRMFQGAPRSASSDLTWPLPTPPPNLQVLQAPRHMRLPLWHGGEGDRQVQRPVLRDP